MSTAADNVAAAAEEPPRDEPLLPLSDCLGCRMTFTFLVDVSRTVHKAGAAAGRTHRRSASEPSQKTVVAPAPLCDPDTEEPVEIKTFNSFWRHMNFLNLEALRNEVDSGLHFFFQAPNVFPSWEKMPEGCNFRLPTSDTLPLSTAFESMCAALIVTRMYAKAAAGSHPHCMPYASKVVGVSAGYDAVKVWLSDIQGIDQIQLKRQFAQYFDSHLARRIQAGFISHKSKLDVNAPTGGTVTPFPAPRPSAPGKGELSGLGRRTQSSVGASAFGVSPPTAEEPPLEAHQRSESLASIGSVSTTASNTSKRGRRGCRGGKNKGKNAPGGRSSGSQGKSASGSQESYSVGSPTLSRASSTSGSVPIPVTIPKSDSFVFNDQGDFGSSAEEEEASYCVERREEGSAVLIPPPMAAIPPQSEIADRPKLLASVRTSTGGGERERDDDDCSIVERSVEDEDLYPPPQYAVGIPPEPSTPGILLKEGEKRKKQHARTVSFDEYGRSNALETSPRCSPAVQPQNPNPLAQLLGQVPVLSMPPCATDDHASHLPPTPPSIEENESFDRLPGGSQSPSTSPGNQQMSHLSSLELDISPPHVAETPPPGPIPPSKLQEEVTPSAEEEEEEPDAASTVVLSHERSSSPPLSQEHTAEGFATKNDDAVPPSSARTHSGGGESRGRPSSNTESELSNPSTQPLAGEEHQHRERELEFEEGSFAGNGEHQLAPAPDTVGDDGESAQQQSQRQVEPEEILVSSLSHSGSDKVPQPVGDSVVPEQQQEEECVGAPKQQEQEGGASKLAASTSRQVVVQPQSGSGNFKLAIVFASGVLFALLLTQFFSSAI